MTLGEHAARYARRRLAIFPLQPRGKAPLTRHGFKDATSNAEPVQDWWTRWPDANIGIAIPHRVIVLDLDDAGALQRLKALNLVLPSTARATTGRGNHFWYRTPGHQARNTVGLLPKVDVRAHGGYVVAPPSIHPSGTVYRWKVELIRSNVAEAPEWLLEKLRPHQQTDPTSSDKDWRRRISTPVQEGMRNQRLAQVAGLMYRNLSAEVAAEVTYCWSKVRLTPPLPETEVFRTIDSIAGCELRRTERKT